MKRTFLILLCFTMPVRPVRADIIQDKTPRMTAIEAKYHVEMLFVMADKDKPKESVWVFLCRSEKIRRQFPVAMSQNAKDSEVEIALRAAYCCAAYDQGMEDMEKETSLESVLLQ